jgi:ribosome recycling factor
MDLVQNARGSMAKVLEVLKQDIATVRTGRAAPSLVENIVVSVYGGTTKMRVMEIATISATDPHTLVITPYDNSILGEIQKGIQDANIGLNPSTDGQVIRLSIPPLSEERRQELIKLMHQKLENGRVMVRQSRHDGMSEIKKQAGDLSEDDVARLEKEMQKATDDFIEEIDSIGKRKEEELLQI